jgi:methylglutaconyl-CoA hydratase
MIERQDLHGDEQGVVILSMNRPEGKNAFSRSFLEAFHQAINELDVDETRILILRSHVPGVFCAGADLKERAQMTDAEVVQFLDRLGNLLIRIEALPFPTVAIVHGVAFGGGLELALACDLRIGTSSTQVGLTETSIGIIPGAGGTQRLTRLLGMSRAKHMIYTAQRISVAEACDLGLVDEISTSEDGESEARGLAQRILRNAPLALRAAKRAIQEGLLAPLSEGLVIERQHYLSLLQTSDRQEGLAAFREKRPPRFEGR